MCCAQTWRCKRNASSPTVRAPDYKKFQVIHFTLTLVERVALMEISDVNMSLSARSFKLHPPLHIAGMVSPFSLSSFSGFELNQFMDKIMQQFRTLQFHLNYIMFEKLHLCDHGMLNSSCQDGFFESFGESEFLREPPTHLHKSWAKNQTRWETERHERTWARSSALCLEQSSFRKD